MQIPGTLAGDPRLRLLKEAGVHYCKAQGLFGLMQMDADRRDSGWHGWHNSNVTAGHCLHYANPAFLLGYVMSVSLAPATALLLVTVLFLGAWNPC